MYWLPHQYLLKWGTTWHDLQQARNNLQEPKTSKKRPEMTCNEQETYNEQETTYSDLKQARNNLQWARKNLEQPTMSKKWPEMIYNE